MKTFTFRALVLYQELCPSEPEKEISRGESIDFNTFSELTEKIMTHPELRINPRVLFTALSGKELVPGTSLTEGDIERKIKEGTVACILKIKISLQSIKWEKMP